MISTRISGKGILSATLPEIIDITLSLNTYIEPKRIMCFLSPSILIGQPQGETETQILTYASTHNISPCIVKPGIITNGEIFKGAFATLLSWTGIVENVSIEDVAAVMLEDVVRGIEEEMVENCALVERGRALRRLSL